MKRYMNPTPLEEHHSGEFVRFTDFVASYNELLGTISSLRCDLTTQRLKLEQAERERDATPSIVAWACATTLLEYRADLEPDDLLILEGLASKPGGEM